MPLSFEWDERKANTNLAKHQVSFEEASTVFGDPRSLTIPDPAHSRIEDRFIIIGRSHRRRLPLVVPTERGDNIASSAPGGPAGANERAMKKATNQAAGAEMQAEYDFSRGVRGKHARRYAEGANVVVLDPDVAKAFPNAEAVNDSLRALAGLIRRRPKAPAGK